MNCMKTWYGSIQYHHITGVRALISLHQVGKLETTSIIVTTRSDWTDGHSTIIYNRFSSRPNPTDHYWTQLHSTNCTDYKLNVLWTTYHCSLYGTRWYRSDDRSRNYKSNVIIMFCSLDSIDLVLHTVYGKISVVKTFAVFAVFHLTVILFPWIMALFISNISLQNCYSEILLWTAIFHSKRKRFPPQMISRIWYIHCIYMYHQCIWVHK